LSACEHALAINPDAVNVRLCFASSLKRAEFPRDAADQFEMILRNHSDDSRVHLSLAHLYAEPLNEPQLAREHYLKVLQLEPAHPQAAAIRYWLATNPSG
jgi:Tfp pilus assembly protein PilF